MKIEISKQELLDNLSEEIKDYLYDAFSQWTDDGEKCIVDNLYKPIANRIINDFQKNKEFKQSIIDNLVNEIIEEIDIKEIKEKAQNKAINIVAKKIVLKIESEN